MKAFLRTVRLICNVALIIVNVALIVLIVRDWNSDDDCEAD